MRYADVSLTDFGCYRNARFDDLPAGLGVVAGPQRAGKTTFARAVRQLPFGMDRGDDLPPAAGERRLAATAVRDGERYALRVSGEAAPQVDPLDGAPPLSPDELVGGLTKAQYRQLFTISLAELQRRPDGVESEEQLSEILLGAAYGDVSEVPELREAFGSEAKRIGGKHGRAVTRLRDPVEDIEEAVADRDAAKRTVDEYEAKQGELDDVEARLAELDDRRATLEAERTRLSVLRSRFDDLREYRRLRAERADLPRAPGEFPDDAAGRARTLVDELAAARRAVESARAELDDLTDARDPGERAAALLASAATVERYDRRVEKWRGQLADLEAEAEELDRERDDLRRRVRGLRADWTALDDVRETPADELTSERVRAITNEVETLREDLASAESDLAAKRAERETLAERLAEAEAALDEERGASGGAGRSVAVGGAVALVGLLVGAAVGTAVAPLVGYAVAGLGVVAGFAYALSTVDGAGAEVDAAPVRELAARLDTLDADVAGLEESLASLEPELDAAEAELDALRDRFDLPADAAPAAVREFYDEFAALRADVRAHDDRRESHEAAASELDDQLRAVAADVEPLVPFEWDDGAPREHAEALFLAVGTASEAVAAAEALDEARGELAARREEAAALLDGAVDPSSADAAELVERLEAYADAAETAAEAARLDDEIEALAARLRSDFDRGATVEAFEPVRAAVEDEPPADGADQPKEATDGGAAATSWAIPALERLADEYATADDLDARLDAIDEELAALADEREALRDERAELAEQLERLASDEDLRRAEERIQRGREQLRSLGEEYATYRIAEHLLDRLHDRFLEAATGPLLEEASEVFARITDEYDGVAHGGALDSLEFLARRDDAPDLDVGALSRATAEQLFLSVRLARIRQFDEPLPVVIDDALTNFDPAHARRTVAFLDELARTNQVLLLTCHPELVRVADEVADVEGYWRLDDGRVEGPSADPSAALDLLDSA